MFKVKVPATSANMGPGFDCIGIALDLYNEVEVYESDKPLHFIWECEEEEVPEKENFIYTSMMDVFKEHDFPIPNVKVIARKCNIPMVRGLGSSSAAIVAGLTLAYALMGKDFDKDLLAYKACVIEGHPDNVVPCFLGGMTISVMDEGKPYTTHVPIEDRVKFMAVIPPYKTETKQSREVLPKDYTRADCIQNVSRASMMINAFNLKDYHLLRTAFGDRIHQPYRLPLLKDAAYVFELFKENGAIGEFMSGSGSTLMGVFLDDCQDRKLIIEEQLKAIDPLFRVELLNVDRTGVVLSKI